MYDLEFFKRIVLRHDVGMGEAYMAGDFEVVEGGLGAFMAVVVANAVSAETERGHLGLLNWLGERLLYLAHLRRPNTIEGEGGGQGIVESREGTWVGVLLRGVTGVRLWIGVR